MIKYIHDRNGRVEAAIVPIDLWELIKQHFKELNRQKGKFQFVPTDFEEMMAGLNMDVEKDLNNINEEWNQR